MENTLKKLRNVLPSDRIEQLSILEAALRARAEGESTSSSGFKIGESDEVTLRASDAAVYGVREAKNSLSQFLNEASAGKVVFIEAGRGGTVAIIGTDTLADVIAAIEEISNLTLGAAVDSLPFRLPGVKLAAPQGTSPARGISRALYDRSNG